MLERRDESRRIGPIITGNVSALIISSIQDQAMWMVIRKIYSNLNDIQFASMRGVWIPEDGKQ
jgi:hypothetical protein